MAKNEKQAIINNKAVELYDKFFKEFQPLEKTTKVKRLRTCTAYVFKDANGYIALRSFRTFVAFITPSGDFVDVLRLVYHSTSCSIQHIAKFCQDYESEIGNRYQYRYIHK